MTMMQHQENQAPEPLPIAQKYIIGGGALAFFVYAVWVLWLVSPPVAAGL